MSTINSEIGEYIETLKIIDTHEHLPRYENLRNREVDILSEYISQYFKYDLISAGLSQADYLKLQDLSIPLPERWEIAAPCWELCRLTGYGRHLDETVKVLYSIDRIDRDTIEELDRRFRAQLEESRYFRKILDRNNIETCLLDTDDYIIDCDTDCFSGICRIDQFIAPKTWDDIQRMETESGIRICSLKDWMEASALLITRAINSGAKALKLGLAYRRSLLFNRVSFSEAEDSFNPVFLRKLHPEWDPKQIDIGEAAQNYMLHYLMGIANQRGITLQIHTGIQAGNGNDIRNADPRLMTNLFSEYPDISFDLFHIGYPFQNDMAVLVKTFPNVFVDMCWSHIIAPAASRKFLKDLIDTVPINKIMAFGGDVSRIDLICGHLKMAKENVACSLSELIADRQIDLDQAKFISGRIFFENPKKLFSL